MSRIVVDGLAWEVRVRGAGLPVLLLHGFTGRGTAFGSLGTILARRFRIVTVDLPGHGRSAAAAPQRLSVERTADDLASILRHVDAAPAAVLGYSLGARIALRLAVAHPTAVRRLVLESPSAGIADTADRAARRQADEDLASRIERDGIDAFVTQWESLPIFASQRLLPAARRARIRAMRRSNSPEGLAASLRGAGRGSMEPLFDRLPAVSVPTLVIAGTLDGAGRTQAEAVAAGIPQVRLALVPEAGHTPHDEQPTAFRRFALDFLQEDPAA